MCTVDKGNIVEPKKKNPDLGWTNSDEDYRYYRSPVSEILPDNPFTHQDTATLDAALGTLSKRKKTGIFPLNHGGCLPNPTLHLTTKSFCGAETCPDLWFTIWRMHFYISTFRFVFCCLLFLLSLFLTFNWVVYRVNLVWNKLPNLFTARLNTNKQI